MDLVDFVVDDSSGGAGANDGLRVSCARISLSERTLSHGGARMLARPCFARRSASHSGISAGRGGRSVGVLPCCVRSCGVSVYCLRMWVWVCVDGIWIG